MNEETARPEITPEYLAEQGLSQDFEKRFWSKVFITPTHWLWEGFRKNRTWHGQIWRGMKKNFRPQKIMVHAASWVLLRGPIPKDKYVLHCCPGKHIAWCVNPDHLYLGTPKENTRDIIQQGNFFLHKGHNHTRRGEQNHQSKLTLEQVEEIRRRYTGRMGEQSELAKEYGVIQATIWDILSGSHWKHGSGVSPGLLARRARIEAERNRIRLTFPARGELSPTHKLTQEQVNEIREKYHGKRGEQSALAREYRVRQGTIWYIVNHITW